MTLIESDLTSDATVAVGANFATPSPTSISQLDSDPSSIECPTIPVTISHVQQLKGDNENRSPSESNNPFRNSPTSSPRMNIKSSKNPFTLDAISSNPFLLQLASPSLSHRGDNTVSSPNISEALSPVETPVSQPVRLSE